MAVAVKTSKTNTKTSKTKLKSAIAKGVRKPRESVRFSRFVTTFNLPATNRGVHPNYKARTQRQTGLRKHGVSAPRLMLNLLYGNGSPNSVGSRGQYTSQMAERNLWRAKTSGQPWYAIADSLSNKVHFLPAFSSSQKESKAVQKMMADTLRKSLSKYAQRE